MGNNCKYGKINLCVLLVYCISPFLAIGQATNIDSLKRVLKTEIPDTLRLNILFEVSSYYGETDLDKSLETVYEILKVAERAGIQKDVCRGYMEMGNTQRKMNFPLDTVLNTFEKVLACCESTNDLDCKGRAYVGIGGIYYLNGHGVNAVSYFQKSLKVAEVSKDTLSIIASYANMANVLNDRKEYYKAIDYSVQALNYAKESNDLSRVGQITHNLGNSYYLLESFDTALVYYEEALLSKQEINAELSQIFTLACIGGIHVYEGRFELAQDYLEEGYKIARKLDYPIGMRTVATYRCLNALKQERYNEAIQLARDGLSYYTPDEKDGYTADFHNMLSESFENINQHDSALVHLKIAQEINDSIFLIDKETQIQQLEIGFQLKQKDTENELLKTEQAFTQQKLTARNYLLIGLATALLLAFGWGFTLLRNIREKKKMNSLLESQVAERTQELVAANEQLQKANYELKSFNHIASHDLKEPIRNVGNYVGIISRQLPDQIKVKFQDYFKIIRQSTSQLYTLIEDIASYSHLSNDNINEKTEVDMEEVVASIVAGLESAEANNRGEVHFENLPTIISRSSLIFVALKNLIENGLKFNESAMPTVRLNYESDEDQHRVIVSDNGIGIDPEFHEQIFVMSKRLHSAYEYQGSGIGLAMTKLAVEKLGGTIELYSELGAGSTFTIILPKSQSAA